jgi:hypothetical protein
MWTFRSSWPFENLHCNEGPHLFVEILHVFSTSNIIFSLMLKCLFKFGGLRLEKLGGKLLNMGCDENIVFQGN